MTYFKGDAARRAAGLRAGLVALSGRLAAQAQVDTKMAARRWRPPRRRKTPAPGRASVAAGYAETSGNSESSAANFKGEGRYDQDRWHHILGATAVGTSSAADRDSESETTAEAYWAGYQAQYDITEALYGFGSLDWYKDRFSAYDQQMYEAAGIGWRILRGEVQFLDLEVGARRQAGGPAERREPGRGHRPAARRLHLEDQQERHLRPEAGGAVRVGQHLYGEHHRAQGRDHRQPEPGPRVHLQAQLGRGNRHVPGPPRPFDKTDTYTTISLEYGF